MLDLETNEGYVSYKSDCNAVAIILTFPLILNAEMSVNYNKAIKQANNYIKDFQYNKLYIVSETTNFSVPFEYKDTSLSVNSSFKTGGLLNIKEFDMTYCVNYLILKKRVLI